MSTKSGKSLVFKEVICNENTFPKIVVFTVFDANCNPIGSIFFYRSPASNSNTLVRLSGATVYRTNVEFDELDSTELEKAGGLANLIFNV